MNKDKEKFEALHSLTDQEHLQHFHKILHFNFWCNEERIFFLWMYDRIVLGNMKWDNCPIHYIENLKRFFEVIDYRE